MAGHRKGKPRRDRVRAERMRGRIASAANEYQAMGHAFDWLRLELMNMRTAEPHESDTNPHAAEASAIARQVMRELIVHTERVIERSDAA